ncbi:hypothetical protein [Fimbriimonas ginsengisoli]|uniref:Uncharacterized protein n=1 Tax=Fimbriimonas ginsengisoli Gsoil 348 TaxID=661478 RepID=A0A068NPF9_FIMGI|nr:hypothetical protein [Fimbriimonas ginsengisoli]AIE84610.1 hypothetical protein OP10G_1242 [Fimbriimonas ginsengisoli Gsoil 348]
MLKTLSLAAILMVTGAAFGIQKKQDKSVHHAAIHAEHWLKHHASAPHRRHVVRHWKRKAKKHDKSVHHSAMHAEHWLKHHVAAPHRKKGG